MRLVGKEAEKDQQLAKCPSKRKKVPGTYFPQ